MPRDGKLTLVSSGDFFKSEKPDTAGSLVSDFDTRYPESGASGFPLDVDTAAKMFRSGLIAIDQNRVVLFSTPQASKVIEADEAVGLRKGMLCIERSSIQRTFEANLRKAVELFLDDAMPDTFDFLGIPDRTGDVRYAIKIVTVTRREGMVQILLSLVDFTDNRTPCRATFASVFRLSDREAELAELFSQGFGLEEISTRMGVALNTTRVHLRSVFQKTSCSGQLALLRTLSRLTAGLVLEDMIRANNVIEAVSSFF